MVVKMMKWRWLPPVIGAVLTVIVCTGLATITLVSTGILWIAVVIALTGTVVTTVLALEANKALC